MTVSTIVEMKTAASKLIISAPNSALTAAVGVAMRRTRMPNRSAQVSAVKPPLRAPQLALIHEPSTNSARPSAISHRSGTGSANTLTSTGPPSGP